MTPLPGSPAPELVILQRRGPVPAEEVEISECLPAPRLQLVTIFRLAPGSAPAQTALSAARFVSALHAVDRKLGLTVDPLRSITGVDEVTFAFTPARVGAEAAERLEDVVRRLPDIASAFEGAELVRGEVILST